MAGIGLGAGDSQYSALRERMTFFMFDFVQCLWPKAIVEIL
jgi:hypothetical protein